MRFHWFSSLAAIPLIFAVLASAEDRKPQAWAVLIGVNDYADLEDLKYASQDVQALSKALASAGFPESHVFLLHDEAKDVKFRPLKANIERQLGLLAQLAAKDDLLVIAFSGHGMHLEGKTYLCPAEAQVENPQGTMVALDGVYSQLEKCPAALRLMLVDACRNDPRPKGKKSATPKDDLSSLGKAFERPPDGIVVLASCAPGQISYEEQDFGHGVFMHQVLKGLGGSADSNKNGKVSLGELYEFAAMETKTFVARARADYQSPQLFGRIDGVFEFEGANWQALFDGESLAGWQGIDQAKIPAGWSVSEGEITGIGNKTLIASAGVYGDFELELEWKLATGGNGGVFYRWGGAFQLSEIDGMYLAAPEFQIVDNINHPNGSVPNKTAGAAFGVYVPAKDATRPVGEWNQLRLIVVGNHVEHWLNGQKVVEYELHSDDWKTRVALHPRLRNEPEYGQPARGRIVLQSSDGQIWYRNIRLRTLNAQKLPRG